MADPSRYRIVERLGKGGMGEVFLADDTQLERKVALKFLPDKLQADPVARQRFEREAKSAAALDHPYICKIHEISEIDGRPCIVMEHISGRTLDRVLAAGPLPPNRVMEIATEVVEALIEAHARRILHRDLKPGNLMLTDQGHVKVMDFGLAKRLREAGTPQSQAPTRDTLTRAGAFVGTPAYMAPEQVLGGDADARSDIFAFGVVLYELLTGVHPFRRSTSTDTLGAILRDAPTPPPDSAKRTDYSIFDKLLAKEPRDRMVLSYAADPRAAELFESRRQTLPEDRPTNTCGSWVALMRGVEGLAVAGRRDEAAALHPLTVRAIDTGTLVEFFSTTMPHLSAGIAAACGEQWDAAEDHYRTGLHHAHALPHRMLQPELRRWYARMLVDRGGPGDRDRARTLLGEAVEMYHTIGMPRHVEMAKDLMKQL